ncbi:hypothetical protein JCM3774_004667 [Rhodotorula dairenensis]
MRYSAACDYPIASTSAPTAPASLDPAPFAAATSPKPRARGRTTDVSTFALVPAAPRSICQTSARPDRAASSCCTAACSPPRARRGPSHRGAGLGAVAAMSDPDSSATTPRRPIPLPYKHRADAHDQDTVGPSSAGPRDDCERRVRRGDLGSSEESLSPDSLAPSSLSTIRSRLFASDDEEEEEEDDEDRDELDGDGEAGSSALSSWSAGQLSPSSCFSSCAAPPPPRRASLSSTAATSDPLRHSFTPPPKLEFDHVRQRGHWVPTPAVPTAETVSSAPDVPDVVRSSIASAERTPPASPPPRASPPVSPPSARPESLLTKSLRSLSRLPNLTLADVLPRGASSLPANLATDNDEDLAALPPGWGPAERRRVLAEEPSHTADEARAGFRYLLRRPPSPLFGLASRRLLSSSSSSSSSSSASASPVASSTLRKSSADWTGRAIDEVEALGYGFGFGLQDLGRGAGLTGDPEHERELSSSSPPASFALEEDAPACADAPTSTSADVPPMPPRPRGKRIQPLVAVGPSEPASRVPDVTRESVPGSGAGANDKDEDESETAAAGLAPPLAVPSGVPPPPPPLPPRFVSNHRHLLMLSLEFEMMRHAKIRGPLRQRAVIVRPATSPPREQGARRERSRLCHEVEA